MIDEIPLSHFSFRNINSTLLLNDLAWLGIGGHLQMFRVQSATMKHVTQLMTVLWVFIRLLTQSKHRSTKERKS
jgi:hypothetical protein